MRILPKHSCGSVFWCLVPIVVILIGLGISTEQVSSANDAFRVTTYEATFSGTTYDLTLANDLEDNYFVMIAGGGTGGTTRNADTNFIRVSADPNGTGSLAASGSQNVLSFTRPNSTSKWRGSITVVESLGSVDEAGFVLLDVVSVTVSGTGTQSSTGTSAAWSDIDQVVTFGGIRGGGVNVSGGGSDDHCYGHGRFWPSSTTTVNVERNSTGCGGTAHDGVYTIYVVEWGSEWNVQRATVTGSAGGASADATSEFNTAAISSVTRDNTWIWAAGHTADGGIGDSFAAQIATLGDGINQNTTETTVAVGAEYADSRSVEVYVLEHTSAAVDYRRKADGDSASLSHDHTVDSLAGETYVTPNQETMGVATQVAMDGTDGGWVVYYGSDPLNAGINLAVDEDDIGDTERAHTTEEIDYWVFDSSGSGDIKNSAGVVIGEYGKASSVGSSASSVSFSNTLSNPVVVTTYNLPASLDEPAVARVDNVSNTGFDVYLQVASVLGSPTASDVYWIAINDGAHTLPGNVSMEAGTANVTGLNRTSVWGSTEMSQLSLTHSYTNPRVLGQIQTVNDSGWQVFWSSDGANGNPPDSAAIYVGRHVGADINITRSAEDVGYIIIEDSTGTTDGVEWIATRTSDTVEGVDNTPPYLFTTFNAPSPPYTIGRFGLQYNSSNGTGTAFPRPYWGVRHTAAGTLKAFRQYSGQDWVSWIQSIDFTSILYTSPPNAPQTPFVNNTTAQSGETSPVTLLTDTTPAFSAIFDDPDTSDTTTTIEIEVGDDANWADGAEMWDASITIASCNEGSRCADVTYAGSTLAEGVQYYWRARFIDSTSKVGAWSADQLFMLNNTPTLTGVTLNAGSDITLSENTTTTVSLTATATDLDGYADLDTALGVMYRSGVSGGASCSANDNNCYVVSSCTLSGCAGTSCNVTCSADIEFFADATDTGSSYPTETWDGIVVVTDNQSVTDSKEVLGVNEMNSLIALDADSSITFGTMLVGEDSGSTNTELTVTNTGNRVIDSEISGSDMCTDHPTCANPLIPVGNIEYSLNPFSYGGGIDLTTSASSLDMNIPISTVNPSTATDIVYTGLSVPAVLPTGNYQGDIIIVGSGN